MAKITWVWTSGQAWFIQHRLRVDVGYACPFLKRIGCGQDGYKCKLQCVIVYVSSQLIVIYMYIECNRLYTCTCVNLSTNQALFYPLSLNAIFKLFQHNTCTKDCFPEGCACFKCFRVYVYTCMRSLTGYLSSLPICNRGRQRFKIHERTFMA